MKTQSDETIVIDISTADLRKGMGEILNKVQYGGSSFMVRRKGKEVGAIVPPQLAREMVQFREKKKTAQDRLLKMLDERETLNRDVPEDELMEEAVRETRAARNLKK